MNARDSLRDLLGWTNGDQVTIPRALAEALVLDEPVPEKTDRLLNVHEAAQQMGISPRTLYKRADNYPFRVKGKGRELRFSQAGLQRWLSSQHRLAG